MPAAPAHSGSFSSCSQRTAAVEVRGWGRQWEVRPSATQRPLLLGALSATSVGSLCRLWAAWWDGALLPLSNGPPMS